MAVRPLSDPGPSRGRRVRAPPCPQRPVSCIVAAVDPRMLLAASSISKSFAGIRALKSVSFDLQPGEVHALVGENGAGKSTLIKVMTGAEVPDAGTLVVHGREYPAMDPGLSRALGIAAIYQQPSLFPDLSVAENIALT